MNSLALPTALPEDIGLSSARLDRLTQLMQDEVAHGRVPGAVALIARRGKIGYFECYGYCDPVKGTPMSKDAIFRIYSMTKPIVTVAAMMLFEQGRILLGDPVRNICRNSGICKSRLRAAIRSIWCPRRVR